MQRKVKVCSVIGFPLGANKIETKIAEATQVIGDGSDEVDVVLNIGAIKSEKYDLVDEEVKMFIDQAKETGKSLGRKLVVKTIVEAYLFLHIESDQEKSKEKVKLERTCEILNHTNVDFVKTCTGFDTGLGKRSITEPEDVAFIRKLLRPGIMIKASGGIRTLDDVFQMVKQGASRIGTSSAAAIMKEFEASQRGPI